MASAHAMSGEWDICRRVLVPMPISHFLVRPRRAAAVRTNAAIDASLRGDNVRR